MSPWSSAFRHAHARAVKRSAAGKGDHRADFGVLVALLAIVAAVWAFVAIAGFVDRGSTQAIDESIVRGLRDPADPGRLLGPTAMWEIARDVTAMGSIPILLLVCFAVAGFLALSKLYRSLILVAAASIGGTIWTFALKELFARPRPSIDPDIVVNSASFPSGHASLSAVIYLTLAALLVRLLERRALRVYVIGCAALTTFSVGLSRVALGMHYPSDVLAGWTLGLAWALFCWTAMGLLQRRGTVETAEEAHETAASQPAE
jgi:undecaprenyl-diphosphatase